MAGSDERETTASLAPRPRWWDSVRGLLEPPELDPDELAAYLDESRRRITERFRIGVPAGAAVALTVALLWSRDAPTPEERTLVLVAGLASVVALLAYPLLCDLRIFRREPNRLILPVSLVVATTVAVTASVAGGFSSVAAALVLLIWIYGSVLAPLPPRTFVIDVLLQYFVITGGIWLGAPPDRVPWMYLTLTVGGLALAVLGVIIRENTDRRSFAAHRRLDAAHGALADHRKELERMNEHLEERVSEQVAEIVEHARKVEALNVQLAERVQERSRELAAALDKLAHPEPLRVALEPGTVIGDRAKVVRLLGAGGMGEVYLAEDLLTGERVALKVMHAKDGLDVKSMQRLLGEARAASVITHPGVVRPLHVDVSADGSVYLLTELVRGETLADRIRRGPPLDPGQVARIGQVLAGALAAAHARGVVHRDVKPHNVMLTAATPGVKLLDFGISKTNDEIVSTALTATNQLVGSPAYMAPEQFSDPRKVAGATDVYSLGLVLFEAAAGRGPFEMSNALEAVAAHSLETPPRLVEIAPGVTEELSDLVDECLAKTAAARPTAEEVATRCEAIADALGSPDATELAPPASAVADRTPRAPRRGVSRTRRPRRF